MLNVACATVAVCPAAMCWCPERRCCVNTNTHLSLAALPAAAACPAAAAAVAPASVPAALLHMSSFSPAQGPAAAVLCM